MNSKDKKVIIFLPNIRRHLSFYKSVHHNFEQNNFNVFFFTFDNSNYNFWSKILPNVLPLNFRPFMINSKEIFEKTKHKLQISGTFETIKKVDYRQAPFKKYTTSVEDYFHKHLVSTISVFNEYKFDFAFGYSALDIDNVVFNIACVHSQCNPIFMDYSPIDNFEISFKKKYYSDFIRSKKSILEKSFSDPNRYLLEKRRSPFFILNRLFNSISLIFQSKNISFLKYFITIFLRYIVYNFTNKLLVFFLKTPLDLESENNYIFLGSCPNESYYVDGGFDLNYIEEIINFQKENKGFIVYFKPHPAAYVEQFLFSDIIKLHNSGIKIMIGKINDWQNIRSVIAVRSSLLIEAIKNGVPAFSLIDGIHTLFGVKFISNLSDVSVCNFNKEYIKIPENSSEFSFPGVQGYYDEEQANKVALSLVNAVANYNTI